MARSLTTPDLVAAILRPVRGVLAGVARRMGAPLSEAEDREAAAGSESVRGAETYAVTSAGAGAGAVTDTVTDTVTVTDTITGTDTNAVAVMKTATAPSEERAPDRPDEPIVSAGDEGLSSNWPSIQSPVYRMRRPADLARAEKESSAPAIEEAPAQPNAPARLLFSMRRSAPAAYPEGDAPPRATPGVEVPTARETKPEADVAERTGGAPPAALVDIIGAAPQVDVQDSASAAPSVPGAAGATAAPILEDAVKTSAPPRPGFDAITPGQPRSEVAAITTVSAPSAIASITAATPSPDTVAINPISPAVDRTQSSAATRPLRLVFEAPPSLAASPAAALSSAPAPSGPAAAFADRIAQAASVVWDDAHRVTHEALTVERNDAGSAASSAPQAAVTNTFNVNVHVDPDQTGALSDREALEQVLCDLLCDAARRHGLEV